MPSPDGGPDHNLAAAPETDSQTTVSDVFRLIEDAVRNGSSVKVSYESAGNVSVLNAEIINESKCQAS